MIYKPPGIIVTSKDVSTHTGITLGLEQVIATYIFAGGDDGIYRANIKDNIWHKMNDVTTVKQFLIVDTDMYAVGNLGVYKSINFGTTWTDITGDLHSFNNLYSIIKINNTLYTVTANCVIYKSINEGINWVIVDNPADTAICHLGYNGTTLFAGDTTNGIYKSIDGGDNWTQVLDLSGVWGVKITNIVSDKTIMWATGQSNGSGGGVWKSIDSGNNWSNVSPDSLSYISISVVGDVVYCGNTSFQILKTITGGASWTTPISTGLPLDFYPYALLSIGNSILTGNGITNSRLDGIYQTIDGGNTWTLFNAGLQTDVISALTVMTALITILNN